MAEAANKIRLSLNGGCFVLIASLLLANQSGCSGSQKSSVDLDPHLVTLTKLYVDHLNANQGMPPGNRQQFEEFIQAHGTHRIQDATAVGLEKLFTSTRDGQPLVMFYGKASDPRLQGGVVGHEQVGVDGKRCVAMRYGTVQLVDQQQFEQLVPSP